MRTKRTIAAARDPRNERIMQKLLAMTEEELNAIFDSSPFYQKKMEQAVQDFQSLKTSLDFSR